MYCGDKSHDSAMNKNHAKMYNFEIKSYGSLRADLRDLSSVLRLWVSPFLSFSLQTSRFYKKGMRLCGQ